MTNIFNRKQAGLAVSCALALGVASGLASAQTDPAQTAFLTDQRGAVVMSGFGLCWHTGFGPAPVSTIECDPNFVPAKIARLDEPKTVLVNERITLAADTLFEFDKAILLPAGRAALDNFVSRLKEFNPEMIMAVGHADRFGSDSYNQRLSEKRAEAVKSYLVNSGIDANRIQTEGKGEMYPVTKADQCSGAKSAKVIACLQPDRRVDIEVMGTRIAR